MQKKRNNLAIIAIVLGILLIGTLYHDFNEVDKNVIPEGYVSSDELQDAINTKVLLVTQEKDSQITSLTEQLANLVIEMAEKVEEEIKESFEYLINNIFIGEEFDKTLSDREVKTLVDSEIEFDDEDYDVEEVIELSNIEVKVNDEDFESNPYLVILEDGIEYTVIFDKDLNTTLIGDDETLSFSFLGEEVEISKWDGNSITFTKGKETSLDVGDTLEIGERILTINYIGNDQVLIAVDGVQKSIKEGKTANFNGLEILVKEFDGKDYSEDYSYVTIKYGKDLENTVDHGDEYIEDSVWEYVIGDNSIGIILKEDFNELDEDYKPLALEESLCLPNDYVCVRYDGFEDEDTEELSFELERDDNVNYVEIRGNFQYELEDYDKILVNSSGIYEDNKDKDLIDNKSISIGSSDVELVLNGTNIVIEDFTLNLKLNDSDSSVNDEKDYDVRTKFGIKVNSPEDAIEDNEWKIVVPYEQLSSTISIL